LSGHEVDVINTVQFSNHTGYNSFRGERFPATHILDLFAGLEANGLDSGYTHLLTGYMGNSENVLAVEEIARRLLTRTPDLFFVLDPVLGDDNALYVPPELVDMYRDILCPLAKLVLPNQFEAEQLTDMKIASVLDAKRACDKLHSFGVPNVVITSIHVEGDSQLHLIGSELDQESGAKHQFSISFPKLDGYFTGSGDFFAAMVLARHASLAPQFADGRLGALARACELATATQAGVMSATREYQLATGVPVPATNLVRGTRPADMVRGFELRIIPSQHLITNPTLSFTATDI
ncbi:putative pyridoxal kinase, partial [Coemansia furcata]